MLFQENDTVITYNHKKTDKKPINEWYCKPHQAPTTPYFCINPIIEPTMGRITANIASITNFMFEVDSLEIDEQLKLWTIVSQKMPIRSLTHSGAKSIHATISMAEPLPANSSNFKQYRLNLLNKIYLNAPELQGHIDNLSDMTRISRQAGAIRPDTGLEQKLLYTGPLMTTEFLLGLGPIKAREPSVRSNSTESITSVKELKNYLQINIPHLYTFFFHAGIWANSAGCYPDIFKNFLWLLEESKCSIESALDMYDTVTTSALLGKGYPPEKVRKPVDHAVNFFKNKNGE